MNTRPPTAKLCDRTQPVKALRVYLRQSKEEQHQKESIPTQRAECAQLAMSLGFASTWKDRIEYIDVDRAGDDFAGREQLQQLLKQTTAGDVVLAWKQDRVGRDMIDAAATIRELVKYRQAKLYTAETGTVPVTLDSAEQTAMVMFRGMVAQGELERIRSRTRDGLRQRVRDGFAAGPVPYGFRTVLVDPTVKNPKLSKKRIEIEESQAAIVRRIFDEYLEGRGYAAIAHGLNREAIRAPRAARWSPSGVWDLLRNSVYVGEWEHGRRTTVRREGNRKIVKRAKETDVLRSARPELAIISADVWERTEARIAERKTDMKALCATAKHPLSGKLRCDQCGGAMRIKVCHGRRADWQRRYYICGTRLRTHGCENSIHVPADEAEQTVSEHLRTSVFEKLEDKIKSAIRAEIDHAAERSLESAADLERLSSEMEELRRERQRLVRLATATDDPIPEIADALKANQDRAKGLERAVAIASRPPIEPALAERLEASAFEQVQRMRKQLTNAELREVIAALFPKGLRFKIQNGLWLIEGAASVPLVRHPDGTSSCRTAALSWRGCSCRRRARGTADREERGRAASSTARSLRRGTARPRCSGARRRGRWCGGRCCPARAAG